MTLRSRSQCTYIKIRVWAIYNSSLPSWIWIIFHTILVHESRVCHDLDPRSYLQGQGHSAHIPKIRFRAINLYCQIVVAGGICSVRTCLVLFCFCQTLCPFMTCHCILHVFSAPEPKAQVHYCDHVLSVVRRPSVPPSSVRPSSLTFHIFDFSSETIKRNSTKLYRKVDLNVLYQVCVFRADRKNKMAALASDWLRHFRLLL